jgi:uncharacterized lipoprotein
VRSLTLAMIMALTLSACGGSADLTCDDEEVYQSAQSAPQLRVPEGMDNLDPLKEVPLPDASPRAPRPAGSVCLERPPVLEEQG